MISREDALNAVQKHVKNENMVRHMLATEAIMQALAVKLGGNQQQWGLAGLLHDIDIEITGGDMQLHGRKGAEMAGELGADDEVCHAIIAHNGELGVSRDTMMDKALYSADPISGLITAAALVRPEKRLLLVEAKSVRKRFKEKGFAAGANREQISACSELELTLEEFTGMCLDAMKVVAGTLGL
ncbi:HDIG domain-containing metalloprotein [Chloroflexota bacterium]